MPHLLQHPSVLTFHPEGYGMPAAPLISALTLWMPNIALTTFSKPTCAGALAQHSKPEFSESWARLLGSLGRAHGASSQPPGPRSGVALWGSAVAAGEKRLLWVGEWAVGLGD